MSATLCWTCQRGPRSGCPWFAEHKPTPGWTAKRRDMPSYRYNRQARRNEVYQMEESYIVKACPLYQPDPKPPKWTGPYYDAPVCLSCYSRKICMERCGTCNKRAKL